MYLMAFYRLDTCRNQTMSGMGAISWMMIMEYCDRLGIDEEEQRDDMEHHIGALDTAYQEWANSQRKK